MNQIIQNANPNPIESAANKVESKSEDPMRIQSNRIQIVKIESESNQIESK